MVKACEMVDIDDRAGIIISHVNETKLDGYARLLCLEISILNNNHLHTQVNKAEFVTELPFHV